MSQADQLPPPSFALARALTLQHPDPTALLDPDLRIVCRNHVLAERLGDTHPTTETSHAADDLLARLVADPEPLLNRVRACLSSGQGYRSDWLLAAAPRNKMELEFTLVPIVAETGNANALLIYWRERDSAAEPLCQQRLRQELAHEQAKAEQCARQLDLQATELARAMNQLARLSRSDALTGLLNRKAFDELGAEALKLAQRHHRTAAVLLCDIPGLHAVNDRRSHTTAEELLRSVARALANGLRSSDIVARIGAGIGEFAILLAETAEDGVPEAAARCCRAVRDVKVAAMASSEPAQLTARVGVAVFPRDGESVDQLLRCAAVALQRERVSSESTAGPALIARGRPGPDTSCTTERCSETPAVLLVDPVAERASAAAERLATRFAIQVVSSGEAALASLGYRCFDAVVACRDVGGEDGQKLLQRALAVSPHIARVLLVESEAEYLQLVARDKARVQCFVVESDYPVNVGDALAETILRSRFGGCRQFSAVQTAAPVGGVQTEALESILAEEAFDFEFQPVVRAAHRQVVGFEAFCRPKHPALSSPVELFEMALQLGVLWDLGRMTRRKLARRIRRLPDDSLVFVNLHPAEIADHQLLEGAGELGRYASRVVFEVPLRSMLPNPVRFAQQIRLLQGHGFGIALDEHGCGYGQLSSLALFKPRFLKLGAGLTAELGRSEAAGQLLEQLLRAARASRVEIVCEQLETAEQVRRATRAGVHLLQGFAIGKPTAHPG